MMLTPPQIAKQLRVDPRKVIGWIRAGKLRAVNVSEGNRPRYRIDSADLQRFLDGRVVQPSTPQLPRRRKENAGSFF